MRVNIIFSCGEGNMISARREEGERREGVRSR